MEKLEEKTQELVQKKQKLDQTKQEPLDWGYSLGTSVYEEHRQDRQGLHSQTRHCSTTTDRLTRAHKLCLYSGFHEPIKQSRAIFAASALLFIFLVAFHFWLSRFLRLLSVSSDPETTIYLSNCLGQLRKLWDHPSVHEPQSRRVGRPTFLTAVVYSAYRTSLGRVHHPCNKHGRVFSGGHDWRGGVYWRYQHVQLLHCWWYGLCHLLTPKKRLYCLV